MVKTGYGILEDGTRFDLESGYYYGTHTKHSEKGNDEVVFRHGGFVKTKLLDKFSLPTIHIEAAVDRPYVLKELVLPDDVGVILINPRVTIEKAIHFPESVVCAQLNDTVGVANHWHFAFNDNILTLFRTISPREDTGREWARMRRERSFVRNRVYRKHSELNEPIRFV